MISKMLVLLFLFAVMPILVLTASLNLRASDVDVQFSNYIIRPDGSVDPATPILVSADNVTYAITSNITGSITVERNDIVIDGFGYALQGLMGALNETALTLDDVSNVTVRNVSVRDFYRGFEVNLSVDVTVANNTISYGTETAIACSSSRNLTVAKNRIAFNQGQGIRIQSSTNCSVLQNTVTNNTSFGIWLSNGSYNLISQNNVTSNLWRCILLDNSADNTISGNYLEGSEFGIFLNNSTRNDVLDNTLFNDPYVAVYVHSYSQGNRIMNNTLIDNSFYGFYLFYSSNNALVQNTITNSTFGMSIASSDDIAVIQNTLTYNNNRGIRMDNSSRCLVIGNTIASNTGGLAAGIELLQKSSNNTLFHNNLINNIAQAIVQTDEINDWDNGFEGNYWNDYNGVDSNGDGIGDIPYVIDDNNRDNYPLMSPYEYWSNPIIGDVNRDMIVNMTDVGLISSNFGKTAITLVEKHCDLNTDGIINMRDIGMACSNFGKHVQ